MMTAWKINHGELAPSQSLLAILIRYVSWFLFLESVAGVWTKEVKFEARTSTFHRLSRDMDRGESGSSLTFMNTSEVSSRSRKAVSMTFLAAKNHRIQFPCRQSALKYLALPVSEYKMLNFSFVDRLSDTADHFRLRFPLREVAAAMEYVSSNANFQYFYNYEVCSSIKVLSDPKSGIITMESGPFFFNLTDRESIDQPYTLSAEDLHTLTDLGFNTTWISEDAKMKDGNMPTLSELPTWMKWSVDSEQHLREGTTSKSFLQPHFSATIRWNPGEYNISDITSIRRNSDNIFSSWFGNRKNMRQSGSGFQADLHVTVGATMQVQIGSPLYSTVSKLPLKIMIEKIVSLALTKVLHEQKESFSRSLVNDSMDRFPPEKTAWEL